MPSVLDGLGEEPQSPELSLLQPPPAAPKAPSLRGFTDTAGIRQRIYDRVLTAARELPPVQTKTHRLELADVDYADPDVFSLKKQREAVVTGGTLNRRLRGTWRLIDNATNEEVANRKTTIAHVPFYSDRGTFILGGNEYTLANQLRLRSGVFARQKDNGELESHVNVLPGKGLAHRLSMDPESGQFKIQLGQAHLPLVPLLRAMGTTDAQLRDAWGDDIAMANGKGNAEAVIAKLHRRLNGDRPSEGTPAMAVAKAFAEMHMDPDVTLRTLGKSFDRVSPEMFLAATKKLLAINKGEAETDDRDHLAYQTFHGPEDLIAERVGRDKNALRRLVWKGALTKNLKHIPPGVLSSAISSAITGSGLGQPSESINPSMILEQMTRVSRLGDGGIPSADSVPLEARDVQPSHFGYLDPLVTPESPKVGVDSRIGSATRKGDDGRLYTTFLDAKTGERVERSTQDISDKVVAFPEAIRSQRKYVPAMVGGKTRFVSRDKVDYVLPDMESAFAPVPNMVPMKSAMKGQRVAMAQRMMTQALPLVDPEAPFVQSGVPGGDESFEAKYGEHMGAIRAKVGGQVLSVDPDEIRVRADDGTEHTVELHNNFPNNRKTLTHNTAAVQPGQYVRPGELLARSNFTDAEGTTALGKNARVAYIPWKGLVFEDAIAISQSMANRLTSEHMYQHGLERAPSLTTGRNSVAAMFPGKYDKRILGQMDEDGAVLPGTIVKPGDPLVMAAKERERNHNSLHRNNAKSFQDASETWDHHTEGVVTDVAKTDKGIFVTVKSTQPTSVGDKLSGRFGDKGVISKVIPDDEMPHDSQGRPFEVIANPLGVITRTNPAQMVEAALGKIVSERGVAPYKMHDFEDIEDLTDMAMQELQKHGLSDTEEITDPTSGGRKIPNIFTGNRFFMKLHHTAECFDAETEALTSRGWVPWPLVRDDDLLATVRDGALVFEQPLEVVRFPFRGDLYCFTGRYLDYAVTGNHRLYLNYYCRKDPQYIFETAEAAHGRRFRIPQFGWPQQVATATATICIGDHVFDYGDYAELVGWWASEGYAKVTHRRACVMIYQSRAANPEHFAKIELLATRLNLPWHYYKVKGEDWGIGISCRDLAIHLKQLGTHSHNKRLPRHLFAQPPEILRRTFDAMMAGDGSVEHTPTGKSANYTTTSKGLADDFQELCVRCGFGAVVRRASPRKESHFLPVWECGVALVRTIAQVDGDRNREGFSVRPYHGVVYCAEMATGLLYVRRRGKPMLSGNSKGQGRGQSSYTSEGRPAKAGDQASKKVSLMDVNALLSHGATEVLRDAHVVRGQEHPDYWQQYMSGHNPPTPQVPLIHRKFVDTLRAAGINVIREGAKMNVMAMTDKDVDHLSGTRALKNADTVDWHDALKPVPGGLFDPDLTGGHGANQWSHIKLHEPMPNPVMEDPIRRVLGLTEQKFLDVIGGKESLQGRTGPDAIAKALGNIHLDREIDQARNTIMSGRASLRDAAVKRLGYLKSAKQMGLHPKDWVLSKVPVLPPVFRPVSTMEGGTPLVADPNLLYKELFDANDVLSKLHGQVDDTGDERLAVYNAFKGVTGLGDPVHPKNQERKVKGLLKTVFGGSPKYGMVQQKLLGSAVDMVGRAVITPDPDLDMDQVGIPEDKAWNIYQAHVVRSLVRGGMDRMAAVRAARDRKPAARDAMLKVMSERPVIINRAPTLHRYSKMAFWPKLVPDTTLHVPPLIVTGFNADFDGDQMNYHVPQSDEAVQDAIDKMMPSRNLLAVNNFRAHQLPGKEFGAGLYSATVKRPDSRRPRVFDTVASAVRAYRRGEIGVDHPVEVVNH